MGGGLNGFQVLDADGGQVAHVLNLDNARLIAAASDLLAAAEAEELADSLKTLGNADEAQVRGRAKALRTAAIANARGES